MMKRWIRLLAPGLMFAVIACNDDDETVIVPPPPPSPLLNVQGTDMSGSTQSVYITQNDTAVTAATVVVNGFALIHAGSGLYTGTVTPAVAPGGTMTIVVTGGGMTTTGVGVVPPVATITGSSSTVRGAAVGVNWTLPSNPDSILVGLNFTSGQDTYITAQRTIGTARTAVLDSGAIPSNAFGFSLTVFPFNTGVFTGDAAPGSSMRIRTLGVDRPFAFGVP